MAVSLDFAAGGGFPTLKVLLIGIAGGGPLDIPCGGICGGGANLKT